MITVEGKDKADRNLQIVRSDVIGDGEDDETTTTKDATYINETSLDPE